MIDFFQRIFDVSDFPARWTCGQWTAAHGWLHITSDIAIWGAYTAIPLVLAYFTLNRRDLPYPRIFWLFFLFILFCGTSHLIEASIFWWPAYRLSGLVKLSTALVSWATVFALIRVLPEALKLPGMARLNEELNREIEERLRVEQTLRETEKRLRSITNAIPGLVALVDRDDRFAYANAKYREWFDLDPEDLTGKPVRELLGSEAFEQVQPYFREVRSGQPVSYESELTFADGQKRFIAASYVPQFDASGKVDGHLALVMDISERKKADERFRIAVEAAPNAMILVNEAGELVLVNSEAERIFGYPREELLGQRVETLVPDRFRAAHPTDRDRFMKNPEARAMGAGRDLYARRADGTEFPVEIGLNPISTSEGTFVLGAVVDITARKRVELALKESEERFRSVADTAPVMIWSTGASMTHEYFNRPWIEFTGRDPGASPDENWLDSIHPDDLERCTREYRQALTQREPFRLQYRMRRADGEFRWILDAGTPRFTAGAEYMGHIGSAIDITDYKRAQDAFEAASRMEATATLAGGIAHDVNNLMMGVLGNASLLRMDFPPEDSRSESLGAIETAATRASTLAQQLLAFARGGRYQPRLVDWNRLVTELLEMRTSQQLVGIDVKTELVDSPWAFEADPVQMSQVLLNLYLNAIEAIENAEAGGRLTLRTTHRTLAEPLVLPHFGTLSPGRYASVLVSDNGCGIEAEKLRRIFDPFFTTKFHGRGLGLAAAYGILGNHGGGIRVESRVGDGSIFEVLMPVRDPQG